MSGIEYFTSERFIHDDLLFIAEGGLSSLRQSWSTHGRIQPFAITWPEGKIKSDDGDIIESHVLVDIPEGSNSEERMRLLRRAVLRTRAYALLFVEQKEDEVLWLFETRHGSKSWSFPIKRHGPDKILGDPTAEEGTRCVGLLWKPTRPE